jgi:hypothetical protein
MRYAPISATELTEVVAEARFDIPRLVEAALHQLLDPCLGGWPCQRGHEGAPFRLYLGIGRQICLIGQALDLRDWGVSRDWGDGERIGTTSRIGDRLEELGCGGCCDWLRPAMMPALGVLT